MSTSASNPNLVKSFEGLIGYYEPHPKLYLWGNIWGWKPKYVYQGAIKRFRTARFRYYLSRFALLTLITAQIAISAIITAMSGSGKFLVAITALAVTNVAIGSLLALMKGLGVSTGTWQMKHDMEAIIDFFEDTRIVLKNGGEVSIPNIGNGSQDKKVTLDPVIMRAYALDMYHSAIDSEMKSYHDPADINLGMPAGPRAQSIGLNNTNASQPSSDQRAYARSVRVLRSRPNETWFSRLNW